MSTIKELFINAQLAEAAYAHFDEFPDDIENALRDASNNMNFTSIQASEFVKDWIVVDHIPDTYDGFSATIFESIDNPGQYTLSIRGSTNWNDWLDDANLIFDDGIAVSQLVDLYNFWQRAITPEGETYAAADLVDGVISFVDSSLLANETLQLGTGTINPNITSIEITGHSLGGHLAMAFTRLYPNLDTSAIAINGLGFKLENLTVNSLYSVLNGGGSFDSSDMQNIYGIEGPEFAAMDNWLLQQPGGYTGIFIEDGGINTKGGHTSSQMTDSLAVYNLFATLDENLNVGENGLSTISSIIEVSENDDERSLEEVVASLHNLLVDPNNQITIRTDNREDLYLSIKNIKTIILDPITGNLKQKYQGIRIADLSDTANSPGSILTASHYDVGVFYALLNANGFAVTGKPELYTDINTDGYLDINNYSEQYLSDKADLLFWKMRRNRLNRDGLNTSENTVYRTETGDEIILTPGLIYGPSETRYVTFDNKDGNTLAGGLRDDHLYGNGGDDTINGAGGDDYIEGNDGNDTINGEAGEDTIYGGKGVDTIDGGIDRDVIHGGEGNDILNGGDGTAKDELYGDAGNDIIHGGDGHDSIFGGDDNDELHGDDGNDYLEGGAGVDRIYGGKGNDTIVADIEDAVLDGGDGYDTYIINTNGETGGSITINDSGDNKIIFNGTSVSFGLEAGTNTWKTADGKFTITKNSPLTITDENGNSLTLNDAAGTDFGIHLSDNEYPTDERFIYRGDDSNERTYIPYLGSSIEIGGLSYHIPLDRTVLIGERGTDRFNAFAPDSNDTFYMSEEVSSEAFLNSDTGTTTDERDWVNSAAGNDIIFGSHGDNVLLAGPETDLILSGGGNDFIFGDADIEFYRDLDTERISSVDWQLIEGDGGRPFSFVLYSTLNQSNREYYINRYYSEEDMRERYPDDWPENLIPGYSYITDLHNDTIYAGTGDDYVEAGIGDDSVFGGEGDDRIYGQGGNDKIDGEGGDDLIVGDEYIPDYVDTNAYHGDDYIDGGAGNDEIYGQGYDDIIYGGEGDDYVDGDDHTINYTLHGNDSIYLDEGNDTAFGSGGSDLIYGSTGDDVISGDSDDIDIEYHGRDELHGEEGNDTLYGNGDRDTLYGGAGDDYIEGDSDGMDIQAHADDFIDGGDGNDTLLGNGGNDTLIAGSGDDIVLGDDEKVDGDHHGNDDLDGGSGNDILIGGGNDDVIAGGMGNDELQGDSTQVSDQSHGNDVLDGGAGDDILFGFGGDDILYGGDGNDELQGDEVNVAENFHGNDVLYGGSGNDILFGFAGDDTLNGGDGQDSIAGGMGNDIINAGSGDDYIEGNEGSDDIDGGQGNDTIFADDGDDTINAGSGDDYIEGGSGNDKIYAGSGNNMIHGGAGDDEIISEGSSTINAGQGTDRIIGGRFNDFYIFNIGDGVNIIADRGGYDIVYFEEGINEENLSLSLGSLKINVGDNGDAIHIEGFDPDNPAASTVIEEFHFANGDVLTYQQLLERGFDLTGTDGGDTIYGTVLEDRIDGLGGNDTIIAKAGDDTIDGGTGADTMHGNEGHDTYIVDNTADLVVEQADQGTDNVEVSVDYTLTDNVENLTLTGTAISGTGNDLDNHIEGNSADNILSGGAGNDRIDDIEGNNILSGDLGDDRIYAGSGDDILNGGEGNDELYSFAGNDHLDGGAGNDLLEAGIGDDVLDGGAGSDAMRGGSGNDNYYVDDVHDTVNEDIFGGNDTVYSSVDFSAGRSIENIILNTNDSLNASGYFQSEYIHGNNANNDLYAYRLNGYVDNYEYASVYITSTPDNGIEERLYDRVANGIYEGDISIDIHPLATNFVRLSSKSGVTLMGNAGDDRLFGDLDNDILIGGVGSDLLHGFAGADTMRGGDGNDTYIVQYGSTYLLLQGNLKVTYEDTGVDVLIENENEGIDTVLSNNDWELGDNFENLTLLDWESTYDQDHDFYSYGIGASPKNGSGNSLDNIIIGNRQDNVLYGLAGNDTIYGGAGHDILDGGTGSDIMEGDTGTDTYIVDDSGDRVIEVSGSTRFDQRDLVKSSISYSLTDYVENLTLTGTQSLDGIGNSLKNHIQGNSGNNSLTGLGGDDWILGHEGNDVIDGGSGYDYLYGGIGDDEIAGGSGNDLLDGGLGADMMNGGSGDDRYNVDDVSDITSEQKNNGHDTVYSSQDHTLGNNLEDLFLQGSAVTGIGNDLDNRIEGNSLDNQIEGLLGNDVLIGNSGNDSISGGAGNDVISGGYGLDALSGGQGDDQIDGGFGDDIIDAGDGNDIVDGGYGADEMSGGTGNDRYIVDNINDVIIENTDGGFDQVESTASYDMSENIENLTLTGEGNLEVTGNGSDNTIIGNDDRNILSGLAGNDTLDGKSGNDDLIGGTGDDVLLGGGEGLYVSVDTQTTYGDYWGYGGTDITVNYQVKSNKDLLDGGEGNDWLDGGSDDDTLIGGLGNDYLYGGSDSTMDEILQLISDYEAENGLPYYVDPGYGYGDYGGTTVTTTTDVSQILTNNDHLDGGAGNDTLDGGSGNDTLIGGEGNDILYGGDDPSPFSLMAESYGYDKGQYPGYYDSGDGYGSYGGYGGGVPTSVDIATIVPNNDYLDGGAGDDQLDGGSGDDILLGGEGTDNLLGGTGNDSLDGGTGLDTMAGGAGDDVYYVDGYSETITIPGDPNTDPGNGSGTTDPNVDNYTCDDKNLFSQVKLDDEHDYSDGYHSHSSGYDSSEDTCSTGSSTTGTTGTDTTGGTAGTTDPVTMTIWHTDTVMENANEGYDRVYSTASFSLNDNIEELHLMGNQAIDGTGNSDDNIIIGNDLANRLDGAAGADTLAGGLGDDTYVVDQAGDQVVENAKAGNDTVETSIDYSIENDLNLENLKLIGVAHINGTGNAGDNLLSGNDGDNALFGGEGDDILSGGLGNDTLAGGAGNDTYIIYSNGGIDIIDDTQGINNVVFADDLLPDNVVARQTTVNNQTQIRVRLVDQYGNELADQGLDFTLNADNRSPITSFTFSDSSQLVLDDLLITEETHPGTYLSEQIFTDRNDDTIYANKGDDLVHSGAGHDLLFGERGDDILFAAAGNDQLYGGEGEDYLYGSFGIDILYGGEDKDELFGGAGNDLLLGGNDKDELIGGSGSDLLAGGKSNDEYEIGCDNDIILYNKGDGKDKVEFEETILDSSITLSLGGGINLDNISLQRRYDDLMIRIDNNDIDSGYSGSGYHYNSYYSSGHHYQNQHGAIVLDDWYEDEFNYDGSLTLQLIMEASEQFDATSGDVIYNSSIVQFDLNELIRQYELFNSSNNEDGPWSITNGLLEAHLASSDSEALGGDIAYRYGSGETDNFEYDLVVNTLSNEKFAKTSQPINR